MHPNIGIERLLLRRGRRRILNRIKEYRGTVILPERTGPIADVLYSAAGNSADEHWYNRKAIIALLVRGRVPTASQTTLDAAGGRRRDRHPRRQHDRARGGRQRSRSASTARTRRLATIASIVNARPAVTRTRTSSSPSRSRRRTPRARRSIGGNVLVRASGSSSRTTRPRASTRRWSSQAATIGLLEAALAYSRDKTAPLAADDGRPHLAPAIRSRRRSSTMNEPSGHPLHDRRLACRRSRRRQWEAPGPRAAGRGVRVLREHHRPLARPGHRGQHVPRRRAVLDRRAVRVRRLPESDRLGRERADGRSHGSREVRDHRALGIRPMSPTSTRRRPTARRERPPGRASDRRSSRSRPSRLTRRTSSTRSTGRRRRRGRARVGRSSSSSATTRSTRAFFRFK